MHPKTFFLKQTQLPFRSKISGLGCNTGFSISDSSQLFVNYAKRSDMIFRETCQFSMSTFCLELILELMKRNLGLIHWWRIICSSKHFLNKTKTKMAMFVIFRKIIAILLSIVSVTKHPPYIPITQKFLEKLCRLTRKYRRDHNRAISKWCSQIRPKYRSTN